jgi:integrase
VYQTITRLAQVLGTAVEYELIAANPAVGRRRRLKGTRPSRPFVEPDQLPALLRAAGRHRALVATLAGAGLRIGEAVALEWCDVNLATGVLRVRESKTDAGVRDVDLTPALREELASLKAGKKPTRASDLVFITSRGTPQTRQNVRRRILAPVIERANRELNELGIEPFSDVSPHGLRRTFASLRAVCGDDPVYIAQQIGHTDVTFTLKRYLT